MFMYRIEQVSSSVTVYRDCTSYHDAIAALDRLQHAFRFTGVKRVDSDRLRVGLTSWTLANEFRIVSY